MTSADWALDVFNMLFVHQQRRVQLVKNQTKKTRRGEYLNISRISELFLLAMRNFSVNILLFLAVGTMGVAAGFFRLNHYAI